MAHAVSDNRWPVTVLYGSARVLVFATLPALSVFAQSESELVVSHKATLTQELEDMVAYGGPREMICDKNGNIVAAVDRKYTSATNAVLRISPDAKSFMRYGIDGLPELRNGDITDFSVEADGHVYLLARQVLQYSDLEVPQKFGHVYVIHYSAEGAVRAQTRLALETKDFEPTGIAVLRGGGYLVVGRRYSNELLQVIAQVFQPDGAMRANLDLGGNGTRPSRSGHARSKRVFRPAAIKSDGLIYLMRGATAEPIYVLSDAGQLQKTVSIKGPYFEFDSPHIFDGKLIVHKHGVLNESFELRPAPRVDYPVFDLRTGEAVHTYYWHQETVGLACYTGGAPVFVGPDHTSPEERWVILSTSASPITRAGLRAP
jgi:hypothetical protein